MIKKVVLCSAIILSLLASTVAFAEGSLTNFKYQKTYLASTFKDVNLSDWYYSATKSAFELGLMGGKAQGIFDPKGYLTLAEAVAIASRVHEVYNGGDGVIPSTGTKWYDGSVAYAIENGIVKSDDFVDYTKLATRAEMAYIFSSPIESKDMTAINNITILPDVKTSTAYSEYIFGLYNAGIVGGSDAQGTFNPSANITRAETVVILKNLVIKSDRKVLNINTETVTPTPTGGAMLSKAEVDKYRIAYTTSPINSVGMLNEYYTKDSNGIITYKYVHINEATPIKTLYGKHTYGVSTQAEYDFVLQKIEEAKMTHNIEIYNFANDSAWQRYYKVLSGEGTDREKKWVAASNIKYLIDEFGEQKAKELYIMMGLDVESIEIKKITYNGVEYSLSGQTAYEEIMYVADCNGLSHLNTAIWDSYGFSTRVLADNSHAWAQVKLSDGKWHDVAGLNVGNQTTNTSYANGLFVLVNPTY
jgi:hypothetical protein